MANRKISQFTTTTDITTVQGLAGYDATTNVQISGSALITSLEANLYKPFGNDGDVLTLVNGAPAWVAGGGGPGGNATMQDVYSNSITAGGSVTASANTADLNLTNNGITITATDKGKFESTNALTLESTTNEVNVTADNDAINITAGTDVILQSDSGNNQYELAFTALGEIRLDGSFGNDNEVILSNGSGNQVEWGKVQLSGQDKSVNGVLGVVNGGIGVGSLSAGRLVVGGGTNALSTITSDGKGKLVVGRTVGAVNSTGIIPVGSDGQVLTADSNVAEYGVKWATPTSGGGDSIQTISGAGTTVEWDFTLGNNAIWTPLDTGAGNPVQVLTESSTASKQFPDGARGCLKIITTNTTNFELFSNSRLPSNQASINAQMSATNPNILYYFYDGGVFNWFYDVNMTDPIYTGNPPSQGSDPSVDTANLIGFWWPGNVSNLTDGQAVQTGQAWTIDPGVSNTLIGDLSCQRSTTSNTNVSMRWYARDNANQIAPYWESNPDQNGTRAAFQKTSITSTNIGDFSVALTFQVNSNTQTGTGFSDYVGLFDLDKDDEAAVYMVDRRLADYTSGTTLLGNFPGFFPAFTGTNDNNINFEDQWIFVHLSYNFSGNIVQGYIGCQATWDNKGTTNAINGADGNPITIDSSGLYGFVTSVSGLTEGAINDVVVWGASSSTNGYSWEGGKQGLCAVWNTAFIPVATIISNWDNIRNSYYIS